MNIEKVLSSKHIEGIIRGLTEKYEIESLKNQLTLLDKKEQKIKVAFLGEFSAGKSTLINALMGKNFLPSFDKPTTAVITEIEKGSEYKFQVIDKIDDEVVTKDISPAELVEEVQKTTNERIIKISVPDSDFLDSDTLIIDTPGVSSINETHSDVTYGYIPAVDVIFLVVNINMGSISKSLKEFINQYPDDIKNKIFFILNFSDTKAPSERNKLVEEFTNSVSEIIESPRIFEVSALNAIKANKENNHELLLKSGILQIKDIIKNEIPGFKNEIFEKRRIEELFRLKDALIGGLNEIDENLNLDDGKLYDNIKRLRIEIEGVENAERSFIKSINNSKEKATEEACDIANKYVATLLEKFARKEVYAETVAEMFLEIQERLTENLPDFGELGRVNIDDKELARTINDISSKFAEKFQRGQEFSKLAMSGLIAAVSPASGLLNIAEFALTQLVQTGGGGNQDQEKTGTTNNSGTQNQEKAGTTNNSNTQNQEKTEIPKSGTQLKNEPWKEKSGWGKAKHIGFTALKLTATIIEKTNLFENLANYYNKNNESSKLTSELRSKARFIVENTYKKIDKTANIFIKENYKIPLQSKAEALEGLRRDRDNHNADVQIKSEQLNKDIYQLKSL